MLDEELPRITAERSSREAKGLAKIATCKTLMDLTDTTWNEKK